MRMQAVEPNKFRAIGIPDTLLICISWEIIRENSYNILNCSKVCMIADETSRTSAGQFCSGW